MQIGFLPLLCLLFIGLKLGGLIAWSWWLVLLPLWVIPVIWLVLFMGLYSLGWFGSKYK